jgi:hypothetical protein
LPKGGFSPLFGKEGCGASLLEFTPGFPLPDLVEDKFHGNDKRGRNNGNDNFLMNLRVKKERMENDQIF